MHVDTRAYEGAYGALIDDIEDRGEQYIDDTVEIDAEFFQDLAAISNQ